jgi:hypothetical protein
MRFLITFCVGVAAALAWQSYGDAAREMIASSYPQLGWLAPQAAVAQTVPDMIVPAARSSDLQDLKAVSLNLATLRQRVDQLAAQVAAGQQQITRDLATKLQVAEQDILDKISVPPPQPVAVPARKPVPPPSQAAPLR